MITCEIDGIWCPKCRKMHPTLFWHDKYKDYELNRKENFEENKKKRPLLFKNSEFIDNLSSKNLEQMQMEDNCIICGTKTFFKDITTQHYVCCDECKYEDEKINLDM